MCLLCLLQGFIAEPQRDWTVDELPSLSGGFTVDDIKQRVLQLNQVPSTDLASLAQTHPFNGHFSGTTRVSWYQKGKTNLDFTEARDSEWQWHQLGHMQVCTSLQTDNHASTPPLSFLQAGCPFCHPTNSI